MFYVIHNHQEVKSERKRKNKEYFEEVVRLPSYTGSSWNFLLPNWLELRKHKHKWMLGEKFGPVRRFHPLPSSHFSFILLILLIFLYLMSGLVYFDYINSKTTSHGHFSALLKHVWIISPPASLKSSQPSLILENFQNSYISLVGRGRGRKVETHISNFV